VAAEMNHLRLVLMGGITSLPRNSPEFQWFSAITWPESAKLA
jgi:hypothetical protein